jgi:hypothetical protein
MTMSGKFIATYYSLLMFAGILGIFQVLQIDRFGMSPLEFVYTTFWLYLPLHLFVAGRPFRVPLNVEYVALALYIASTIASSMAAVINGDWTLHQQVMKTTLHFVFVVGIMYVHGHIRFSASTINNIVRFYLSMGVVLSVYAIYQVPARILDWPLAWIQVTNVSFQEGVEFATGISQLALRFENFYRATSIYSEPSALGYASAIQIAVALVPIVRKSKHFLKTKWAITLSLSTSIIALFLAFSMTGILVMGMCLLAIILRYPQRVLPRLMPVIAITAAGIVVVDTVVSMYVDISVLEMFGARIESYITGSAFKEEVGSIVGESATQRYDDAALAVEVWKDSPIIGYGPGCFRHHPIGRFHNANFPSNTFATLLADNGLLGLTTFVLTLVAFLVSALLLERRWTRAGCSERYPNHDALVGTAPIVMVGYFVVNVSGNSTINPVYWLNFVFIVVALQFSRKALGEYRELLIYGNRKAVVASQQDESQQDLT